MTQVDQHPARKSRSRLVVPAYFDAARHAVEWGMLAERAADLRLVILNPASGPGTSPDPAHVAACARLLALGVTVAGYVDTDYGQRPLAAAIADLRQYRDWYQVTGVCFDRTAAHARDLGYYAEAAGQARAMGVREVMFNHGTHPAPAYAEHADVIGTFEGPWSAYADLEVPAWTAAIPRRKLYHVVHSTPQEYIDDAFHLAERNRAGCVYITDRSGGNPYDGLPADWRPANLG